MSAPHLRLGVNIDHVATVRNARGSGYPDPVRAALLAAEAGADGITAHLREDRRHITDDDIARLVAELTVPICRVLIDVEPTRDDWVVEACRVLLLAEALAAAAAEPDPVAVPRI